MVIYTTRCNLAQIIFLAIGISTVIFVIFAAYKGVHVGIREDNTELMSQSFPHGKAKDTSSVQHVQEKGTKKKTESESKSEESESSESEPDRSKQDDSDEQSKSDSKESENSEDSEESDTSESETSESDTSESESENNEPDSFKENNKGKIVEPITKIQYRDSALKQTNSVKPEIEHDKLLLNTQNIVNSKLKPNLEKFTSDGITLKKNPQFHADIENLSQLSTQQKSQNFAANDKKVLPLRPGQQRRLPDTIIIGVDKCTGIDILRFLQRLPAVSNDLRYRQLPTNFFTENYKAGVEWYISQMPPSYPGQIAIEQDTSYFTSPSKYAVPEHIKTTKSNIKLILKVCDPMKRLILIYTDCVREATQQNKKPPSFDEFVSDKLSDKSDENNDVSDGCYSLNMKEWLKFFPLDQIHIIDSDEIKNNPLKEMVKLEKYLGLEPFIKEKHFMFDKESQTYCLLHPDQGGCVRNQNRGKTQLPRIDPFTLKKLMQFYSVCNKHLYEMVHRSFNWTQADTNKIDANKAHSLR